MPRQKPGWRRWGLWAPTLEEVLRAGVEPFIAHLFVMIGDTAHDRVARYLSEHPEAAARYNSLRPWPPEGDRLGYFDVFFIVMSPAELAYLDAVESAVHRPQREAYERRKRLEEEERLRASRRFDFRALAGGGAPFPTPRRGRA